MSKDFEKAYRELALTEVPDLWDRIEAGLTEKSAPAKALDIENAVTTETVTGQLAEMNTDPKSVTREERNVSEQVINEEETKKENNRTGKSGVLVFLKRYSTAVAAIVCVAILIPAISLIGIFGVGGSKSMETESAAEAPAEMADYEMAETTQEAAAEEALAENEAVTEEAAAEEAFTENEAVTEEAAAEAPAEEAPMEEMKSAVTEGAAAEEQTYEKQESAKEESGISEESRAEDDMNAGSDYEYTDGAGKKAKDLAERCPDGTVVSKVEVKIIGITDAQEYFAGSEEEEGGRIYYAEVVESPTNLLTQGEQIDIFISEYSSIGFISEETYELTISSVVTDEKCYFEIEEFHQRLTP